MHFDIVFTYHFPTNLYIHPLSDHMDNTRFSWLSFPYRRLQLFGWFAIFWFCSTLLIILETYITLNLLYVSVMYNKAYLTYSKHLWISMMYIIIKILKYFYNFNFKFAVLMRIFIHTSGIVHVWNLYFYMKIAIFRKAVLNYVSCGYYNNLLLHNHKHVHKEHQTSFTNWKNTNFM